MRLAFAGNPGISVVTLDALVDAGHEVGVVVTSAPKRRGRGSARLPSPVEAAACRRGLDVSYEISDVVELNCDLCVVVAYGAMLRPPVLGGVPLVNLHFSLLPRWRGAAPVERAILAGDTTTGVCVMEIEEGLDTGQVYASRTTDVADKTLGELWNELSITGTQLLLEWIAAGCPDGSPQVGEATYAHKLDRTDRHIDWSRSAKEILRVIRVGGAWTTQQGRVLKVWDATTSETASGVEVVTGTGESLVVTEVQPEGKAVMSASDWQRGLQGSVRFE